VLHFWAKFGPSRPIHKQHFHKGPSTSVSSLTRSPGHDALTADHPVAWTGQEQRRLPKLATGQALPTRGDPRTCSNWINPALDLPDHGDDEHRHRSRCSGWLSGVKLKGSSRRRSQTRVGAKTRTRRARVDLEAAGHNTTSHGGADRWFGGNPKLGSSGEQLEARLGGLGAWLPYGPDGVLNL
jgi:hypothetical protein